MIAEILKGIRRDGRCEKISQKVKHRNKEGKVRTIGQPKHQIHAEGLTSN